MVPDSTSDSNLVRLAGYHAYLEHDKNELFRINETRYRVRNIHFEPRTGLDALTVENLETNEFIIVYVGTNAEQIQDLITDAYLLSDKPVPQLVAAQRYYERMDAKYGVNTVTGNSLGGALANSVAVKYPDVRSVTYNPALLPAHMIDEGKDYDNITNYIGEFDILTGTIFSLGLGNRIPGKKHEIYNGIPGGAVNENGEAVRLGTIGSNHTGFLRVGGDQHYTIRTEGQPGHGQIQIAADEHIVPSIWSDLPVYESKSYQIAITPENLNALALGLEGKVLERLNTVHNYLNKTKEIIDDEAAKRHIRIRKMQTAFEGIVVEEIGDSIFEDITWMGEKLKANISYFRKLLDVIETQNQSLTSILGTVPSLLTDFIYIPKSSLNRVDVSTLIQKAREELDTFEHGIDVLTNYFRRMIEKVIPSLLNAGIKVGASKLYDTVVEEMKAHFEIVIDNNQKLMNQIETYKKNVKHTANHFEETDQKLADNIAGQKHNLSKTTRGHQLDSTHLIPSPYLNSTFNLKKIQLESSFLSLNTNVKRWIIPIVEDLHNLILAFEKTLESISIAVKLAPRLFFRSSIPTRLVAAFTDFDDKVINKVDAIMVPLDILESRIEGVRLGLYRLKNNMPVILKRFRPYIEHAIFNNDRFGDVYLYNRSAIALLKETDLLFDDMNHQLAKEKAKAILELLKNGKMIDKNNSILQEQIQRGTFY